MYEFMLKKYLIAKWLNLNIDFDNYRFLNDIFSEDVSIALRQYPYRSHKKRELKGYDRYHYHSDIL